MSINDKIKELINNIKVSEFDSLNLEEYNLNKEDFWKDILNFLKQENVNLGHYLVRDSDDVTAGGQNSTVFGRIDELADLDEATLTNLLNTIYGVNGNKIDLSTESGTIANNYYWNESVNYGLALWLSKINPATMQGIESDNDNDMTSGTIKTSGASFKVKDIKSADAGRNFSDNNTIISGRNYVRSWYNIDKQTYSQVRSSDAISGVLNNPNDLDFTHKSGSDWIRLLMPEYDRAVEVEDLDRNFWVIAQVITAISAYLFDENSPIPQLLKTLIEEIVQLWENVLYLWAALAVATREPYYDKLHCEVTILGNSSIQPYIKFDNFDNTNPDGTPAVNNSLNDFPTITLTPAQQDSIWSRLEHLVDKYSECNLCIVPEIRIDNYKHNYYEGAFYPGAFTYDRNTKTKTFIPFNNNLISILDNVAKMCYGMYKSSIDTYQYIAPLAGAKTIKTLEVQRFVGAIRCVPSFYVEYTDGAFSFNENGFFRLNLQDGVYSTMIGGVKTIYNLNWKADSTRMVTYTGPEYEDTVPLPVNEKISIENMKGFYLGEMISREYNSSFVDLNLNFKSIKFEPIGGLDWYPSGDKNSNKTWAEWNPQYQGGVWSKIDDYRDTLREDNLEMLRQYIDQTRPNPESVTLYVANRQSNLSLSNSITSKWNSKDTARKRQELYGKKLGSYYTRNPKDGSLIKTGQYYQGHYYDPHYDSNRVRRYYLNPQHMEYYSKGYKGDTTDRDNMWTLRHPINDSNVETFALAYDVPYDSKNQNALKLNEGLTSGDNDATSSQINYYNTNGKVGREIDYGELETPFNDNDMRGYKVIYDSKENEHYGAGAFRYSNSRQNVNEGAILYAPFLFAPESYNEYDYHNADILLPIKDESPSELYDDLALGLSTKDDPQADFGRRKWNPNYYYLFVKRGESIKKDNWFIMYIQPFATFDMYENGYKRSLDNENVSNSSDRMQFLRNSSRTLAAAYQTNSTKYDASSLKMLKRKGISGKSLTLKDNNIKYESSYVGGANSNIVVEGNTLKKNYSSNPVSPMIARYCAIREEINRLIDELDLTLVNDNTIKEAYQKKNFVLTYIYGEPDKYSIDWSLMRIKQEFGEEFYKAFLRTAIINTDARFNGNIQYKNGDKQYSYKAQWGTYRSKTKAGSYLGYVMNAQWKPFMDEDFENLTFQNTEGSNISKITIKDNNGNDITYNYGSTDFNNFIGTVIGYTDLKWIQKMEWEETEGTLTNKYTVEYDLAHITVEELLLLNDRVASAGAASELITYDCAIENEGKTSVDTATYATLLDNHWTWTGPSGGLVQLSKIPAAIMKMQDHLTEKFGADSEQANLGNYWWHCSANTFFSDSNGETDIPKYISVSTDAPKTETIKKINFPITNNGLIDIKINDNFDYSATTIKFLKEFTETLNDDNSTTFYESVIPIITQTRYTFFNSSTCYSAKAYLVDESYRIFTGNSNSNPWGIWGINNIQSAYGITSVSSNSKFKTYCNYVKEWREDTNVTSTYERIDGNQYALDFFTYPFQGWKGNSSTPYSGETNHIPDGNPRN